MQTSNALYVLMPRERPGAGSRMALRKERASGMAFLK
jgi:hypothetical protein